MGKRRFSIAGLMGVVLVAAIGTAALRIPTGVWAGVMMLVAGGVLVLAVIGALCRTGKERAWWLGFSLFGWAYILWSSPFESALTSFPPVPLPEPVGPTFGPFRGGMGGGMAGPEGPGSFEYWEVRRWLWSLMVALLGGAIARALFGAPATRPETEGTAGPSAPRSRWRSKFFWLILPAAGFYAAALVLAANRWTPPDLLVSLVFLVTFELLGAAILSAIFVDATQRPVWLGAALFGGGYLILAFLRNDHRDPTQHLPTESLLNALRPAHERITNEAPPLPLAERSNERIIEALRKPVDMHFPMATPLEDILKYAQSATRARDGWEIPIYVEPVGLQEEERTMTSPVTLDLSGVPLKTSLHLAVAQLGLAYRISDGLLLITSEHDRAPVASDPFLMVGHCAIAFVAGIVGWTLARIVGGSYRARKGQPA